VRLPVFLGRRPVEPEDPRIQTFYRRLLSAVTSPTFSDGDWALCEHSGWADNSSFQNLVAWSWTKDADRWLIVVNLSHNIAQGHVRVPWEEVRGASMRLVDALCDASYERAGSSMLSPGLYVELMPWGCHCFQCSAVE